MEKMHSELLLKFCYLTYLTLCLISCLCHAYNYCASSDMEELCGKGGEHFMCNPDILKPDGEYMDHVPMTNKIRRLLVMGHNMIRNATAGGEETTGGDTLPAAACMRELIWDKELEYIAQVHAGQCCHEHDKCHNTRRFPYSGQNLALQSGSNMITIEDVVRTSLMNMFAEKMLVTDGKAMAKEYNADTHQNSGHFTVIVNDQVSRVGCSLAYCRDCKGNRHCYYLTCNYDMTNMAGVRVYLQTDKEPGSECINWDTEKSTDFTALCQNNGKIYDLQKK